MHSKAVAALCAAGMLLTGVARGEVVAPGVIAPALVKPGIEQLGKELTVQNWILCTSQANAESIAKARADGVEPALRVYGDLQRTKACGVFPTMKVILRQSLYESPAEVRDATRVYRASVNFGSEWPTGFVVYGVLPQ